MTNEYTLALKIAAAYIRVSDERQDEYSPQKNGTSTLRKKVKNNDENSQN